MRPLALLPLAVALCPVALWPAASAAQDGPSYDCRDSDTRTEIAICESPELARLEMRMFEAYQGLVASIGEGEARRIADELLLRRQACDGDPNCIAERLLISMEVFQQRARPRDLVAEIEPAAPAFEEPAPDEDVAALDAPPPEPQLPLAAQAPWPPETVPIPPSRGDRAFDGGDAALAEAAPLDEVAEEDALAEAAPAESDAALADEVLAAAEPAEEDLAPVEAAPVETAQIEDTDLGASPDVTEAIDGVESASSDGGGEASFDTPVSWAFMDLSREDRAALQARLTEAGLYAGPADGSWNNATRTALETAAAEAGTGGFDLSSQGGAALLLDFVSSDAFTSGDATATLDDSQF